MKITKITPIVLVLIPFIFGPTVAETEAPPEDLRLPPPRMEGGKPLMTALKNRQSLRAFSPRPLPMPLVSDLLWAAFGINRPESGKRTAPSARNWQEIEIYVVMADGAYVYDAKENLLKGIAKGDLREHTGLQSFVSTAPINLVYVVDTDAMKGASAEDRALYYGADTAFISQNVYLFCASEGLATVVRGMVNREKLAEVLMLPDSRKVVLAQTVGYPKDSQPDPEE